MGKTPWVDYFKPLLEKKETGELLLALNDPDSWSKEAYEAIKRILKERNVPVDDILNWGDLSPDIVCSHCHTTGFVRTQTVTKNDWVLRGTALLNVLNTVGTMLSDETYLTQAHCTKCGSTWKY